MLGSVLVSDIVIHFNGWVRRVHGSTSAAANHSLCTRLCFHGSCAAFTFMVHVDILGNYNLLFHWADSLALW